MYTFTFLYKCKPGSDIGEIASWFGEMAVPIYQTIPGVISIEGYKYLPMDNSEPEYDFIYVEVWDSKEAHDKAEADKIIGMSPDSQVAKTGLYDKMFSVIEKSFGFYGDQLPQSYHR